MKVGPYEVISELGRGGMGVVYRARSPAGEDVAVKVLLESDEDTLARFDRERRILALFTTRDGFVPLLEAGMAESGPYLVMPFIAGGTLRERLDEGALPLGEALALVGTLATALGLAHAKGIVHRDLKPENVIFAADGKPLIADLGLAKHFLRSEGAANLSLSATGEVLGTPGYMAPEQAGEAVRAGPEADVFALGAILHECLTGARAFDGPDQFERMSRAALGMAPPLRKARPDAPPHVGAATERALSPNPAKRFRNAAELGEALRPRSRAPVAVIAGTAAVALILLLAILRRGSEPPPDPGAFAPMLVAEAKERIRARDFTGARTVATTAIALDPKLATAWDSRGLARANGDDWDAAFSDLSHALELDPKLAMAWVHRAWLRGLREEWESCIADSTQAIALDPHVPAAWQNRALAHVRRMEWDAALTDLDQAIALDPKSPWAWHIRAMASAEKGELDRAIEEQSRALELDPGFAAAYAYRGLLRARKGDLTGGTRDLERSLELAPDDPRAPSVRAELERMKEAARSGR